MDACQTLTEKKAEQKIKVLNKAHHTKALNNSYIKHDAINY